MRSLSPLTAVISAIVPMTWGLVTGERLGTIAYPALGLALIAVVLVGFVPEKGAVRPSLRGLLMATGSGALIGAFYILIAQTPDDSGLVPLVANRVVNATLMITVIVVLAVIAGRRHVWAQDAPRAVLEGTHGAPRALAADPALASPADSGAAASGPAGRAAPGERPGSALLRASAAALRGGWRAGFWLAVGCGVLDAAANAIVLIGLRIGDLTVVSVLTALYPAGTILLAAVVLRERIARLQWVGLALALAASAMLSLA